MCSLRPEPWVDPINRSEAAVKLSELLFSALGYVLPQSDLGGGNSPVSRAAGMDNGVLIDMSLFNEVTISKDENSVVIGFCEEQRSQLWPPELLSLLPHLLIVIIGEFLRVRLSVSALFTQRLRETRQNGSSVGLPSSPSELSGTPAKFVRLKMRVMKASIKNKRQNFGTMAIKNNLTTLNVVYDSYKETITSKATNIKEIDTFDIKNGTNHRYRYLSYCGENCLKDMWRKFEGNSEIGEGVEG
ncbi:FAD binding domain-containing protein [Microsporum canis CBS 113480]|uniref:FAD binding domain-containing protein n=1 Tax=Arthroderma otae (strain ATCC MYA-4605 / CBS 113480) TaxID=554155 RepID=C5FTV3_ARTOC|nr:FAD binding domain-containing protein [Microsporum canis CBS 113480]EEQ33306.1 FAD binding domain-containing protein [Microsporum canis CBS 113480]